MLTKQELRQLQEKELGEELTKSSRELIKIRMDHAGGTLKETHRLQELKKYVAVMKTITAENKREATVKTAKAKKTTI